MSAREAENLSLRKLLALAPKDSAGSISDPSIPDLLLAWKGEPTNDGQKE